MTVYQKNLHHAIHGPDEPLPVNLADKLKSTAVIPLQREPTSQLPLLPNLMQKEQTTLSGLRTVNQGESRKITPQHPPISGPVSPTSTHLRHKIKGSATGLIRKRSSELLLNSDPETVMTRYFPPLESLTDPLEIADRLKREPELGFLYLTPMEERNSVKYNPYNLK